MRRDLAASLHFRNNLIRIARNQPLIRTINDEVEVFENDRPDQARISIRLDNGIESSAVAVGVPTITRRMSYASGCRIGRIFEAVYRTSHLPSEPPMTHFLAAQLAHALYFDISAARRDFSYEPLASTEVGEEKLIEWLLSEGS